MTIEWLVEFRGEVRRIDTIESPQFHAIIAGTKEMLETALAGAEDELDGLRIVYSVKEDGSGWGFKFAGTPFVVNLARDLVGERREIPKPAPH